MLIDYTIFHTGTDSYGPSVGKNNMGITPVNALGTVDQHSQLQLYLDGPKDKFFTFISTKFNHSKHTLDCSFGKIKNISFYIINHLKNYYFLK